eukprot:1158961-Pelagomonas_calceolata.AAC.6
MPACQLPAQQLQMAAHSLIKAQLPGFTQASLMNWNVLKRLQTCLSSSVDITYSLTRPKQIVLARGGFRRLWTAARGHKQFKISFAHHMRLKATYLGLRFGRPSASPCPQGTTANGKSMS